METVTAKDILRNELNADGRRAVELLYNRYSGMLFSYILQFVPDRSEAEQLLVNIFSLLIVRLEESFQSSLSIYCWLQIEARKIILEYFRTKYKGAPIESLQQQPHALQNNDLYFSLLGDASPEHQWVFRELFVFGRTQQELARQSNKAEGVINDLFKECLFIIRKKLT